MKEYYLHSTMGSGKVGLFLCALTVAIWMCGVVFVFNRNRKLTVAVVETIWLIAPLRACMTMLFLLGLLRQGGEVQAFLVPSAFANAVAIPFIEASLLSSTLLVSCLFGKRDQQPPAYHCMAGIVAAIGAVMMSYFVLMHPVLMHRLISEY
jgi:hypothetical protein